MRRPLRVVAKLFGFLWFSIRALSHYWWSVRPRLGKSAAADHQLRADWTQRWGAELLKVVDVEVVRRGNPPTAGLLACNHLSYLDIPVLAAARPQVFLSKAEVRSWPIIGALTRCAGTLYVQRERRADVADLQSPFRSVIEAGLPITLFPEGTSSDGSSVLPFHSALFEPAARGHWPVTPAWITYRLEGGNVGREICYWGDMTFFPHFLGLLGKRRIIAEVVYGHPLSPGLNRKEMATALHREISLMAQARLSFTPLRETSAR